mgnify:CR=1 FL=1
MALKNTRAGNYPEWYQNVVSEADMAENSSSPGCMVIKPWGYGIWERIRDVFDEKIKSTDHENCYFPMFIPLSFFQKEAEHVDGFAKEMAVVTHSRLSMKDGKLVPDSELDEPLIVRPTSEAIIADSFSKWVKSYRDLPLRVAEFGMVNRYEASGSLMGLMRVREFTQDDAHIFCTPEQMEEECVKTIKLILDIYKDFGFEDVKIYLSTRPDSIYRIGSDEIWDISEKALANALEHNGYKYEINEGEGAFYGPKLEFILRDAIGREWQCGTVQMDMNLPQRFDISYIGEDGEKHQPVMLHRALFGSIERFLGILIENHAGKLPLWLSPEQVVVCPIVSDIDDYAEEVVKKLQEAGLYAKSDLRNEKINYKVREHSLAKVPVIAVVGAKEKENGTVTVRRLGSEKQETVKLDDFVAALVKEAQMPHLHE